MNGKKVVEWGKWIGDGLWKWRILVALVLVLAIYATQFWVLQLPEAKAAYSISNSARFNNNV